MPFIVTFPVHSGTRRSVVREGTRDSKGFPDAKAFVTFHNKRQLNSLDCDYDNTALFFV